MQIKNFPHVSAPCMAGEYMAENKCQQCGENTYSGAGASSCTSCPDGMTSAAGSISEDDCQYGRYIRLPQLSLFDLNSAKESKESKYD